MTKKVNPNSQRLPIKKNWKSDWYSDKNYGDKLQEDLEIRKILKKQLRHAGIGRVVISRQRGEMAINIFTSRPGIVIGHKGEGIKKLKNQLQDKIKTKDKIRLDVKEIRKPEVWAKVMADQVAYQIEKRVNYRRAMGRVMEDIMRNTQINGAIIQVAGRLGGLEIARSDRIEEGTMPTQTLRTDIDYGFSLATTKFGSIGIKVWINRGEFENKDETEKGQKKSK